jgi:uncharacterized protein (TIGR00290 family)
MDKQKVIFCWSGGKDSALALYEALNGNRYHVVALLTTINKNFRRVSMHGVREELVELQADSIGLPLIKMYVSESSNSEYEAEMEKVLLEYKSNGIEAVIFGDIFLEDLRSYREANLARIGLKAEFPLWKKDTSALIQTFFELNFKTIVCCVNDEYLGESKVGVELNQNYILNLPEGVDACGENGEYHTFCYAGPIFKKEIKISVGEKIYKPLDIISQNSVTKGFWYADIF